MRELYDGQLYSKFEKNKSIDVEKFTPCGCDGSDNNTINNTINNKINNKINTNKPINESFAVGNCAGFGNDCSTTDIKDKKKYSEFVANISQKDIQNNMKKIVTNSLNDAMQELNSEIQVVLNQTNQISFKGHRGDIIISGSTQSNESKADVVAESIQSLENKFKETLNKKLSENIRRQISSQIEAAEGSSVENMIGDGFDAMKSIVGDVTNVVSGANGIGIGNSFENKTVAKSLESIKKHFNTNQDVIVTNTDDTASKLSKKVNQKNLNRAIQKIKQNNKLSFENGTGNITIDTITQKNVSDIIFKALFNSSAINNASSEVKTSFTKTLESISNASSKDMVGDVAVLSNMFGSFFSNPLAIFEQNAGAIASIGIVFVILGSIILIIVGYFGYYYYKYRKLPFGLSSYLSATATATATAATAATATTTIGAPTTATTIATTATGSGAGAAGDYDNYDEDDYYDNDGAAGDYYDNDGAAGDYDDGAAGDYYDNT
jgi:hypothetical protein